MQMHAFAYIFVRFCSAKIFSRIEKSLEKTYVNAYIYIRFLRAVKFSREAGIIRVSIPNYGINFPYDSKTLPDEFKSVLNELGWSEKAIKVLERKIILPNNGKWPKNLLEINAETGKLKNV